MAVVVSQSQNELKMLDDQGLDIRPHRERMNREDLAEKFKDADDPLRLVFVCAMWMTGFDAPSVSTVYLDRPMKNHTLMQTIARANRVFPEKDNGLIVDYVGVFRNLEKALAIYGAASAGESPIEIIDALAGELDAAVADLIAFCSGVGVDLLAMRDAEGFDHVAKRDAAVEALLVDEETRNDFLVKARQVRKLFKALLPNPKAAAQQRNVAAIRVLAERIAEVTRPPAARHRGRRRRGRRPARPLGRRRGVRHPRRRRGHQARPPDRPVADRLRRPRRQVRRPQASRDRPARPTAPPAGHRSRPAQPDPLRAGRADRAAHRRLQRRQRQHRRVPAPPHRAVQDPDRRRGASRPRRHDRGGARDLRPADPARPGAHR